MGTPIFIAYVVMFFVSSVVITRMVYEDDLVGGDMHVAAPFGALAGIVWPFTLAVLLVARVAVPEKFKTQKGKGAK